MGKKQVAVSLRKPPPPADFDRFVTNAVASAGTETVRTTSDVAPAPPPPRPEDAPVVATRLGERREVTIYLPQDLARKLSVRCVELDRDISNVIAEAVSRSLDAAEGAPLEAVTVPEGRWERVRTLLDDLRARVPARFRFGLV